MYLYKYMAECATHVLHVYTMKCATCVLHVYYICLSVLNMSPGTCHKYTPVIHIFHSYNTSVCPKLVIHVWKFICNTCSVYTPVVNLKHQTYNTFIYTHVLHVYYTSNTHVAHILIINVSWFIFQFADLDSVI